MSRSAVTVLAMCFLALASCRKEVTFSGDYRLSYGDSILYLRAGNPVVYPTEQRPGSYSAFPDGLVIDATTGAIDLAACETGLRYRITHTTPEGKETSTVVVVSGINYTDKFYNLSLGDSIAPPVYNASETNPLPLAGSVFDEGNQANNSGCSVATVNGSINLAASIRNGLLGSPAGNDSKREVDIVYRLNDRSGKAQNKVRVKLYFYHSMATVAPDLLETLQQREEMGVFLANRPIGNIGGGASARSLAEARPRPPCIIIIAN